jgi:HEAT repeat protein
MKLTGIAAAFLFAWINALLPSTAVAQAPLTLNAGKVISSLESTDEDARRPGEVELERILRLPTDEVIAALPEFSAYRRDARKRRRDVARSVFKRFKLRLETDPGSIIPLINSFDKTGGELNFFIIEILTYFRDQSVEPLMAIIREPGRNTSNTRGWSARALFEVDACDPDQLNSLESRLERNIEINPSVRFWTAVLLAHNRRKSHRIFMELYAEIWAKSAFMRITAFASIEKVGDVGNFDESQFWEAIRTEAKDFYPRAKDEYAKVQAEIRKRPSDYEVSVEDEERDSEAVDNLVFSAKVRATVLRILASRTTEDGDVLSMLLSMLDEPPIRAGNTIIAFGANVDLNLNDFSPKYAPNDDLLNVLPAFRYVGKIAVSPLIKAYDSHTLGRLRIDSIDALGQVGEPAKEALTRFLPMARDRTQHWFVRQRFIAAIGAIGPAAPADVIPVLIAIHRSRSLDSDENAAEALESIAVALALAGKTDFVMLLREAQRELESNDKSIVQARARKVELAAESLNTRWWEMKLNSRRLAYAKYGAPVLILPVLLSIWLILYGVRPIWLFRLNEQLSKIPVEYSLLGIVSGPLRYLLLVGFFHYRRRVLDAWLEERIADARERFSRKVIVAERKRYVPIPVKVGDSETLRFEPRHLREAFKNVATGLLIRGDGGSGKTSLACMIGTWCMSADREYRPCDYFSLPVVIEDLKSQWNEGENIVEHVARVQVKTLTQSAELPSSQLVRCLLKNKRVLVIIDGVSEMASDLRGKILQDLMELSANAVAVTCRAGRFLEEYSPLEITPMLLKDKTLAAFLSEYIEKLQDPAVGTQCRSKALEQSEFFELCRRVPLMTNERAVTALLAGLFAQLAMQNRRDVSKGDDLEYVDEAMPQNCPDVILHYINYLNREFDKDVTSNANVQRAAKIIAWECIKDTFQPTAAKTRDIIDALASDNLAPELLDHLEANLRLIRRMKPGYERTRFSVEPIAEYLGCMRMTEVNIQANDRWEVDLARLNKLCGDVSDTTGFLRALEDCCSSKYASEIQQSAFRRIGKLTGVSVENAGVPSVKKELSRMIRSIQGFDNESLEKLRFEVDRVSKGVKERL